MREGNKSVKEREKRMGGCDLIITYNGYLINLLDIICYQKPNGLLSEFSEGLIYYLWNRLESIYYFLLLDIFQQTKRIFVSKLLRC